MKWLVILVLAVVCSARSSRADEQPALFAKPPELPAGYDASTALRLDLAGALQMAIAQNIGMTIERKSVQSAAIGIVAAEGAMYDTTVNASYSHSSQTSPPQTAQAGVPGEILVSSGDSWGAGVAQHLPTGGSISTSITLGKTSSTSGMAPLPVTYGTMVSVLFTQPLFRGFSRDLVIPQMSILQAKIGSENERLVLATTAANVVQQTEGAYWDVVGALYTYRVAVDAKTAADDTLALTRRQIAAGIVAPSELAAADSTAAARQVAVLQAIAQVEQSWDALRIVLNLPRDQWTRPILPTDVPQPDTTPTPSVDAALETAVAHRPEVAQMDLDRKLSELAIRRAENDSLPQIDLNLGGNIMGQGASASGAIDEIGARDATGWTVGVSLQWTPRQRASKANLELAHIQRDVKEAGHEQHIAQIWNEVRSAVRGRNAAVLGVAAATRSRQLAHDTLDVENKKYVAGSSSSIAIASVQQNLASAEIAELQALIGNARATTALLLATGRLLEARHIELVVAKP